MISKKANDADSILLVGVGSRHGDDRAGWEVIDRLADLTAQPIRLRKAAVPHDLLDWLQRETHTHIVDASNETSAQVGRYEVIQDDAGTLHVSKTDSKNLLNTDVAWSALRSGSSHQFDLLSTLQLAAALGRLPRRIVLWTIPVVSTEKNADLNPQTSVHVEDCAACIRNELHHA